jgi:hypothetical protein
VIVFRSWGAVPLIAIPACLATVGAVCDAIVFTHEDGYSLHHAWPIALGLVLAGVITLAADRFRAAKMYDDGHLFFIRAKLWGYLCFAAAVLYVVIRLTGDV